MSTNEVQYTILVLNMLSVATLDVTCVFKSWSRHCRNSKAFFSCLSHIQVELMRSEIVRSCGGSLSLGALIISNRLIMCVCVTWNRLIIQEGQELTSKFQTVL